jgi:hypothetical protein
MTAASRPPSGGYPLSTLFLLIAAAAVVLGMAAPALHHRREQVNTPELLGAAMASGMGLAALGCVLGLFQHRRGRGALWGIIVGGALGLLAGPLAWTPQEGFPQVLVSALGGAALVVGIAAAIRLSSRGVRGPAAPAAPAAATAPAEKPRKRHPLDPDD